MSAARLLSNRLTGREPVDDVSPNGGALSARRERLEAKVTHCVSHPVVVGDHTAQVIARGQGGRQMDRIDGTEWRRAQSSGREQQISGQ